MRKQVLHTAIGLLLGLTSTAAPADDFTLDWWTMDGGGDMWCTGDDFELSGTIGQPDAGVVMTGGGFELTGGFWAGIPTGPTILVGDLNCDGEVNFEDINPFVLALCDPDAYEAMYPGCPFENRDINGDGLFDFEDINPFVALLSGN